MPISKATQLECANFPYIMITYIYISLDTWFWKLNVCTFTVYTELGVRSYETGCTENKQKL